MCKETEECKVLSQYDNGRRTSVIPNGERHENYSRDKSIRHYHNNVHFIKIESLIRDLIFFRLPISPYSLSTFFNALIVQTTLVNSKYKRKDIEDFCVNYTSSRILNFYTADSFFHKVLNQVLRQKQLHIIYQYRQVIIDLINKLRHPFLSEDGHSLILHRGQQMTIFELEKMKNNIGELVATSSFLSTSQNSVIAEIFAGDGSNNEPYLVSVIIKIEVKTGQPMRPYARIHNSAEDEVLFSPGTRFKLKSCRKLHNSGQLWLVKLEAISEKQQEQLELTYGETFLLLSSASGWPTSVVMVHLLIT